MQLEQPAQTESQSQSGAESRPESESRDAGWSGTVPAAFDLRIIGLVVVAGGLAASVNIPFGGLPVAIAAFVLLAAGGTAVHALGERQLRRITAGLVERWSARGGQIEDVTRSSNGMQTEWTIHTAGGNVVVGGFPLFPMTKLTVEWQGVGDTMDADEAEENIDALAKGLYAEIFEIGDAPQQS
ncbi:hypothetical protein [Natronolimnohabitans innermongolicus]|uniref:Uncharacterized protein n=1 Tax=Natronolimnohabitans innermongolicus JCM 12255 TaxID=1227499 RepID=L9WSX3_9EURY|nr:hypothetical protein [Natronolimnohabitans innermongolicus]ELY52545.1 hypothetical protein C493_15890 [Natronolimnohabitans innermongolicus JCM 12255]